MTEEQVNKFDVAVFEVEEGDSNKAIPLLLELKQKELLLVDRVKIESMLSIAYANMSSWPRAISTAKHVLRMSEELLDPDLIRKKYLDLCDLILSTGEGFNSFLNKYERLFWYGHLVANFTAKRCLIKLLYHKYLETELPLKKSQKLWKKLHLLTNGLLKHTAEEIGASLTEYRDIQKIYNQIRPLFESIR